jgi:hypothetical protein
MRQAVLPKRVSGFEMRLLRQQTKPDVLILVFTREFAPVENGGEGREIPRDLRCPRCPGKDHGRLWRHGHYERFLRSKSCELQPIQILRLRCSKCGKSQACLFDFMVPYRQYSAEALGELVWPYLSKKQMTYEEFEWASEDGKGHRNLVFTVLERVCQMCVWLVGQVEKRSLRPGESLWGRQEPEPRAESANAWKARKAGKEAALNQVAGALMKFKKHSGAAGMGKVFGILQCVGMVLPAPLSLLTGAKVFRLYATHSLECRLF